MLSCFLSSCWGAAPLVYLERQVGAGALMGRRHFPFSVIPMERSDEESLPSVRDNAVGIPRCARKDRWELLFIIVILVQTGAPRGRSGCLS